MTGRRLKIKNLYEERLKTPGGINENGMSLGMIIRYGKFSFYTAGDFSDKVPGADGQVMEIEDALAAELPKVDAAKINHHGHNSMPAKIVSALSARIWLACVWDQLHTLDHVLDRLSDRNLYPGPRTHFPTVFPKERCESAADKPFMQDIAPEVKGMGAHVVITVPKGGETYRVTCLKATDESMEILGEYKFDFQRRIKMEQQRSSSFLVLFLAPVKAYLEDDDVSEILINGPKQIYVEKHGKLEKTDAQFVSEPALRAAASNIAKSVQRILDDNNPRLDARLPDGSRVHAVIPPLSRCGTVIAIRKFKKDTLSIEKMLSYGSLVPESKQILEALVKLHKNVIVSGGTSSGKTSVLNALSSFIPKERQRRGDYPRFDCVVATPAARPFGHW